jgi:hypothetical protein
MAAAAQEMSKHTGQKADDEQDRAEHDLGMPQARPANGGLEVVIKRLARARRAARTPISG